MIAYNIIEWLITKTFMMEILFKYSMYFLFIMNTFIYFLIHNIFCLVLILKNITMRYIYISKHMFTAWGLKYLFIFLCKSYTILKLDILLRYVSLITIYLMLNLFKIIFVCTKLIVFNKCNCDIFFFLSKSYVCTEKCLFRIIVKNLLSLLT